LLENPIEVQQNGQRENHACTWQYVR